MIVKNPTASQPLVLKKNCIEWEMVSVKLRGVMEGGFWLQWPAKETSQRKRGRRSNVGGGGGWQCFHVFVSSIEMKYMQKSADTVRRVTEWSPKLVFASNRLDEEGNFKLTTAVKVLGIFFFVAVFFSHFHWSRRLKKFGAGAMKWWSCSCTWVII